MGCSWAVPYSVSRRLAIVVISTACVGSGLVWGMPFLSHLQLSIDPPPGSDAYNAKKAFEIAFPQQAAGTEEAFILLLSRPSGLPVLNASSDECLLNGKLFLASRCPLVAPLAQYSIALVDWLQDQAPPSWWDDSTLSSYQRFHSRNYSLLQSALLNLPHKPAESNATIMRVQMPLKQARNFSFVADLYAKSAVLVEAEGGSGVLQVQIAGMPTFLKAAQDGVKADLELMDTVSLPLALLIFVAMLRSARLLLLPILNIIVVVSSAFSLMYPVSLHLHVASTVPSLMISVSIAMSIDYSLFLLSRFREEIERGRSPFRAVELMMSAAGHTVLVSGTTIALCFAGLATFPIAMLRTMGIGAGATAAVSVIVNLTLTPTFLLTFPRFFSDFTYGGLGCCLRGICGRSPPRTTPAGSTEPLNLSAAPSEWEPASREQHSGQLSGDQSSASHANGIYPTAEGAPPKLPATDGKRRIQCWARVAGCTQRFSLLTIALVLLAALPFVLKVPTLKTTADFALLTPRGAPCTIAYNALLRDFGSGAEAPYELLLQPRAPNASVASQPFFDDVNALIRFLAARNGTRIGAPLVEYSWLVSVTGIVPPPLLGGGGAEQWLDLNYSSFEWLETRTEILGYPTELGAELHLLWNQQVSSVDANRTMSVGIRLPFDPFSDYGSRWLVDFREAMVAADDDATCACNATLDTSGMQLANGGGAIMDAISTVYGAMPIVIGMTFVAAFGVVFLAFRSLFVPLRAVLSIALTMGWVYGILIWIYQEGGLAWTGIESLAPTPSGICWIVPVITFAVMLGLGLDYDVFLLTRVYELRLSGASNTKAVTVGLVRSGNVITAAGLIMAIAFCGLLLNSTPTLNQMACVLVVSVLVDTFVVRTLLLPAVMSLLGRLNWWPRRMPEPLVPDEPASLGCSISCFPIDGLDDE